MDLVPGQSATVDLVVGEDDTAIAAHSGDVPVLATPRLVALAEQAAVEAIAGAVPEAQTTVGWRVQVDHLAPTVVGESVRAEAVLESIAGRRVTFRVTIMDEHGLVGVARVTRVIVDRERFLDKATGND